MELLLVEPIDDRALVHLEGPEGEARALVPSTQSLTEGETVDVEINPEGLFVFDGETEDLAATTGNTETNSIQESLNVT